MKKANLLATQIEIGERIRSARERVGLTQETLATAIGKDQRAIWEYETGKRKIAATDLEAFARVLSTPVNYFFGDNLSLDDLDLLMLHELRRLPTSDDRQIAIRMIRLFAEAIERHDAD